MSAWIGVRQQLVKGPNDHHLERTMRRELHQ
jgi:hypothetical protein